MLSSIWRCLTCCCGPRERDPDEEQQPFFTAQEGSGREGGYGALERDLEVSSLPSAVLQARSVAQEKYVQGAAQLFQCGIYANRLQERLYQCGIPYEPRFVCITDNTSHKELPDKKGSITYRGEEIGYSNHLYTVVAGHVFDNCGAAGVPVKEYVGNLGFYFPGGGRVPKEQIVCLRLTDQEIKNMGGTSYYLKDRNYKGRKIKVAFPNNV